MTAVAAVLVAVMLLTTGGAPLLYSGLGQVAWEDYGTRARTPLERRMEGVQRSLERVQGRRNALELRGLLAAELRRTTADPVAFTWTGDALVLDRALTARLDSVWTGLPSRHAEVRTAVIYESERGGWYDLATQLDSTGLCIVRRPERNDMAQVVQGIRSRAGACLFAEGFGVPGAGAAAWLKGASRTGIPWGTGWRGYDVRWPPDPEESAVPAWFGTSGDEIWELGSGWRYRPIGRSEMACLVGRPGQCAAAAGVGAEGWPGLGVTYGYIYQRLPSPGVPRDLLTALGPDKFAEVWRSADPIATSFARVTGSSMDGWLREWAFRYVPEPRRDNALSLTGWIGALLWLALLGLLTAERLKQRAVT